MKKITKILWLLLVLTILMSVFMTACGQNNQGNNDQNNDVQNEVQANEEGKNLSSENSNSNNNNNAQNNSNSEKTEEELEPVELVYYIHGAFPQKDEDEVFNAVNEVVKEEINATLDIKGIAAGDYAKKMQVVQASNEKYDLCFTSNWRNDYLSGVAKGAYLPLDELISEYAPKAYSQIPEGFWDAVKVKGKIYGFINYQVVARNSNLFLLKDVVEETSLDLEKLAEELKSQKKEMLHNFYDQVHEKHPNMLIDNFSWPSMYPYNGMEYIIHTQVPGAVRFGEEKAINQFNTKEFKDFIEEGKYLNEKGYTGGDTLATSDISQLLTAKQLLNNLSGTNKPGMANIKSSQLGVDVTATAVSHNYITTGNILATLTGISRNSENPERAMMYLELINTDKELFNIFTYGIEDKHWEMTETPGVIRKLDAAKDYNFNKGWQIGCDFNNYIIEGNPVNTHEITREMNETGIKSELLGFVFDSETIVNEIGQCKNVYEEYYEGFRSGLLDTEKDYDKFLEELETAGAQKIIDEINKQIEQWKASK